MFTALVLVCSAGTVEYSPDTCYTVMNKILASSYDECVTNVKEATNQSAFDYWDGNTGETWRPVNFQCISWTDSKV